MKKVLIVLMIFILLFTTGCDPDDSDTGGTVPSDPGIGLEIVDEELNLSDTLVKSLYAYVNIIPHYQKNYYFYSKKQLAVSSFDNIEKHYFAFRYIPKNDFVIKGKNGSGTFTITPANYQKALERYFGPDVEFTSDATVSFKAVRDGLVKNASGIDVRFNTSKNLYTGEVGGIGGSEYLYEPIYARLVGARKYGDTIILTQKYIFVTSDFTDADENASYDELWSYDVYADYDKLVLLASRDNIEVKWDKWSSYKKLLKLDDFISQAGTIEYTFKLGSDNEYHFYSSELK